MMQLKCQLIDLILMMNDGFSKRKKVSIIVLLCRRKPETIFPSAKNTNICISRQKTGNISTILSFSILFCKNQMTNKTHRFAHMLYSSWNMTKKKVDWTSLFRFHRQCFFLCVCQLKCERQFYCTFRKFISLHTKLKRNIQTQTVLISFNWHDLWNLMVFSQLKYF